MEEERRLCYVGMTRAKQKLYLIHASSRLLYGNSQHNLPSRFISDIPEEIIEENSSSHGHRQQQAARNQDESFFDDMNQSLHLNIGDKVVHPVFGEGEVLKIDETEAEILFQRSGQKTLNLMYAPLKKL
jgi:DNA helicase-2/ATP-dependent DNA helicase PcrA